MNWLSLKDDSDDGTSFYLQSQAQWDTRAEGSELEALATDGEPSPPPSERRICKQSSHGVKRVPEHVSSY